MRSADGSSPFVPGADGSSLAAVAAYSRASLTIIWGAAVKIVSQVDAELLAKQARHGVKRFKVHCGVSGVPGIDRAVGQPEPW